MSWTATSSVLPPIGDWTGGTPIHPYVVCDVFAVRPLEGNQLAVFLDGRPLTGEQMQSVAREMNIAETVFLLPPQEGGDVALRIFTPTNELPFAGHPVLGTSFVVGTALGKDTVVLETGGGKVPVSLERENGEIVFGQMSQPIPSFEPFSRSGELLQILGLTRSELPVDIYRNGPEHVFVKLADEDSVVRLRPDLGALADLGVAANCFAGRGTKWKTRVFYPGAGVSEDAATGSAAGPLAVHLARHGAIAFGDRIEIVQGVEIGRPSVLYAKAEGADDRIDSIEVGGRAHVVAEGRMRIAAP